MHKYNDTYYVIRPKDKNGKPSFNKDDNYIPCKKKAQIYRYSDNTLAVIFNTKLYAKNRVKELSDLGVELKKFQTGDDECSFLFDEKYFKKVARNVGAKKRIKRELTEEQKEVLRLRLQSMRELKQEKSNKNENSHKMIHK